MAGGEGQTITQFFVPKGAAIVDDRLAVDFKTGFAVGRFKFPDFQRVKIFPVGVTIPIRRHLDARMTGQRAVCRLRCSDSFF